jgi:hypothetical protein
MLLKPLQVDPKSVLIRARQQLASLIPWLLLIYVPILVGLSAIVVVYLNTDIPPRIFFIDPVSEFNAPMYVGLLSNFGVLLWGAAASVCLFGGWLALNSSVNRESGWFLICAGLISAMLMFDDLYLLHEEVFEDHLFIHQKFVILTYVALVLMFLVRFRNLILSTDFVLLLIAFGFLALSVLVDLLVTPEEFTLLGGLPGRHLVEDGLKLTGIATWSFYLIRTSVQEVTPLIRPV